MESGQNPQGVHFLKCFPVERRLSVAWVRPYKKIVSPEGINDSPVLHAPYISHLLSFAFKLKSFLFVGSTTVAGTGKYV